MDGSMINFSNPRSYCAFILFNNQIHLVLVPTSSHNNEFIFSPRPWGFCIACIYFPQQVSITFACPHSLLMNPSVVAASQASQKDLTTSISTTSCWPATASTGSQCLPTGSVSRPVTVGVDGALRFNPVEIDANIGDVIEFTFLKLNHTLTQSTLLHPCSNIGGFSTGFNQFNPSNNSGKFVVKYPVTTLDPQWFFCAQTQNKSHCQAGMVFALNAAEGLNAFQSAAAAAQPSLPALSTTEPLSISIAPASSFTNSNTESTNTPSSSIATAKSVLRSSIQRPDVTTQVEQLSSLFSPASQTSTPAPKYPNSTNQTSAPIPGVFVPSASSMGTKEIVVALASTLTILLLTMLFFVSL
jgi:plastocyanin